MEWKLDKTLFSKVSMYPTSSDKITLPLKLYNTICAVDNKKKIKYHFFDFFALLGPSGRLALGGLKCFWRSCQHL